MVIFWRIMSAVWGVGALLNSVLYHDVQGTMFCAGMTAIFSLGAEILEAIKRKGG